MKARASRAAVRAAKRRTEAPLLVPGEPFGLVDFAIVAAFLRSLPLVESVPDFDADPEPFV